MNFFFIPCFRKRFVHSGADQEMFVRGGAKFAQKKGTNKQIKQRENVTAFSKCIVEI